MLGCNTCANTVVLVNSKKINILHNRFIGHPKGKILHQ